MKKYHCVTKAAVAAITQLMTGRLVISNDTGVCITSNGSKQDLVKSLKLLVNVP